MHRVLFNEITKKAITAAIGSRSRSTRTSPTRSRRAGSSTAWWATRSARSCGTRCSAAVRGPRAIGRGAPGVRARARDQGVRPRGILVGRGTCRGPAAAVRRQFVEARRREGRAPTSQRKRVVDTQGRALVVTASSARSGARTAGAVHHFQAAAGRRAQAALLGEADDGARPAALRRRRARRRGPDRPHHLHAYRLDADPRRRDREARAHASVRRRVPAGEPDRLQEQEGRAGRPRSDPPESLKYDPEVHAAWAGGKGAGATSGERRSPQALHAHLEPLRRLPDGAGGLRPDLDRHRRRPGRAARQRPGHEVPRLPLGLRRDGRGRRQRGRDGRRAARPARRGGDSPPRDQAGAALHAAAAAVLRGDARQGARGEGDRPAVDLRGDPVDHPGPRLRREEARGASTRRSWA